MRLRVLAASLFFTATALPACGASNKPLESDWSDAPDEKPRPVRDTETLGSPSSPGSPATQGSEAGPFGGPGTSTGGANAPLGVRHDLMLSDRSHPARCACLSAEAGPATDPNFFWAGGAPDLGPDAIAFAIGARGIDCPGGNPDSSRRRPSISAVDQENNDIVIEVEDLPQGRPLASGAIVPRPGAGGAIYVRPRAGGQVYARGAPGGRCKVR